MPEFREKRCQNLENSHFLRLEIVAQAPLGSSDSILSHARDSSRVVRDPQHPGTRLLRDWFWLGFEPDVSRETRQQIIDSVDGVAIGGMSLGNLYLIQLPPEACVEMLKVAVKKIAQQRGVRSTMLYVLLESPTSTYLRPVDGSSCSGWTIRPASAPTALSMLRGDRIARGRFPTNAWCFALMRSARRRTGAASRNAGSFSNSLEAC